MLLDSPRSGLRFSINDLLQVGTSMALSALLLHVGLTGDCMTTLAWGRQLQ